MGISGSTCECDYSYTCAACQAIYDTQATKSNTSEAFKILKECVADLARGVGNQLVLEKLDNLDRLIG